MGVPKGSKVTVLPLTGPRGEQGAPGASGVYYLHTQTSAASSWTVVHNLGRFPHIDYIDPAGAVWIADVEHVDTNHAVLSFPGPTSGKAACS